MDAITTPNFQKLVALLKELFQLDQAELDFGIYRILNQKRDEVTRFLERDLLPQVKEELSKFKSADKTDIEKELAQTIQAVKDAGVDPEISPEVQALRAKLGDAVDFAALEDEVYSHLYTFFRRYYKDGDFLSLRRYKEGVYAIPYEGEEVKLHWANADQYYIKSGEQFRDYVFKLPDGRRAHFKLVEADTELGDNKPQAGGERRFILCDETPSIEDGDELLLRFEYRPDEQKRKQAELNQTAAQRLLGDLGLRNWLGGLSQKRPTEKNPNRTLLEKHLNDYTSRNTFDYFIHKDLGGFLRRELDFFIKNEIMHLDDIESDTAPRVEQYLSKIKALRGVARKLIRFLEQLENFQKKLWLKKKFVVETHWCLTLDRVPEALYPDICANAAQREEWVRLFAIDELKPAEVQPGQQLPLGGVASAPAYSVPLTVEFLNANPFLVLDTKFFNAEFKHKVLASIDDIDAQCDGVLVHGENFGALSLLQERYREQIKCVYIDPPYNTGNDGFNYKDSFRSSSWISMMLDRIAMCYTLQSNIGIIFISIDDFEIENISRIMTSLYNSRELAKIIWDKNRKNDSRFFSIGHEYMIVYAKSIQSIQSAGTTYREQIEGIQEAKSYYTNLLKMYGQEWDVIKKSWMEWFSHIPLSDPRRRLMRYTRVGPNGPYRDDKDISWPGGGGPQYQVVHPITQKPCKQPRGGWRFSTPERFWEEYKNGKIIFGQDETTMPRVARFLFNETGQVMPTVNYSYAQVASNEFSELMRGRVFENPKNWKDIKRVVKYVTDNGDTSLDFFAGSGTTAHAVINLNREDGGKRKYILVEVGVHFNTVLKPRIQKVVYSDSWKDGKPVSRKGSSHMFKYFTLESYEDALNNLELKRDTHKQSLLEIALPMYRHFREEYLLGYMLDLEAAGSASLLNLDGFDDPFAYKMNIATGSAGETKAVCVDLVETFNYLIGLRVKTMDFIRGVCVVTGLTPQNERALVIWRKVKALDNAALDAFFRRQDYRPRDAEFDVIYVNGDNNLENLRREDETWKVRLIEQEFKRLMFAEEER